MRSTSEPRIRQQVIAANVAWKATYTSSYSGVCLAEGGGEGVAAGGGVERAAQEQPAEAADEGVALR